MHPVRDCRFLSVHQGGASGSREDEKHAAKGSCGPCTWHLHCRRRKFRCLLRQIQYILLITAFAGWLSYLYSLLLIHDVLGATSTTTSITQLLAPGIRTGDHRIAPTEWLPNARKRRGQIVKDGKKFLCGESGKYNG